MINQGLTICICTYQRAQLLNLLLEDISRQTVLPELIVVVDGCPDGEVIPVLQKMALQSGISFTYLPSNHPNLSYQRYLGWLAAQEISAAYLLYLDDDLRLHQQDAIEKLVGYLQADAQVVGVTSVINFGKMDDIFSSQPALADQQSVRNQAYFFLQWFRSAQKVKPGGLSPTGNRFLPIQNGKCSTVQWLRGGVMLFRMSALTLNCFSADLFALDHIRCGKGEDTILSRRVMQFGKLVYAHDVVIDHPNSDIPKTYPTSAYKLAYATAYSRRFLNDHYRTTRQPYFRDRMALLGSYIGNGLINFGRAFVRPRRYRFAYATGYFVGSMRGLIQKPTAKNMAPQINWWADAGQAFDMKINI